MIIQLVLSLMLVLSTQVRSQEKDGRSEATEDTGNTIVQTDTGVDVPHPDLKGK